MKHFFVIRRLNGVCTIRDSVARTLLVKSYHNLLSLTKIALGTFLDDALGVFGTKSFSNGRHGFADRRATGPGFKSL